MYCRIYYEHHEVAGREKIDEALLLRCDYTDSSVSAQKIRRSLFFRGKSECWLSFTTTLQFLCALPHYAYSSPGFRTHEPFLPLIRFLALR